MHRKTILSVAMLLTGVLYGTAPLLSWAESARSSERATYLKLLPVFWREIYPNGGETLYCGQAFAAFDSRVNVEHVFPMSWVTNSLRCGNRDRCRAGSKRFNEIESDMHNLWPALKRLNRARGSLRFGLIRGEERQFGWCDFELDSRRRLVEPRPQARGIIARSMFYMSERYKLPIFSKQGEMLKRWHFEYPPGEEELRRNALIQRLQGHRNLFIDHPEKARELTF